MRKVNKILAVALIIFLAALFFGVFSINAYAADPEQYYLGLIPESPTEIARNMLPESQGKMLFALPVPSAFDNTSAYPAPGNQGQQGSCVAWAVAYAYKTYQDNLDHRWGVTSNTSKFSPAFVYNQTVIGNDGGSYISHAMNLLVRQGCCSLADMPYNANDYKTQPTSAQKSLALPHRSLAWYTIQSSESSVKSAIVNYGGVVIGIPVYPDFDNINPNNPIYDTISGKSRGNHAICLIGYDDSRNAYKFINSWGVGTISSSVEFINATSYKYAKISTVTPIITITTQPQSTKVAVGSIASSLSVSASATPNGIPLYYQWYSNTTNSNTGGAIIIPKSGQPDAVSPTYFIPSGLQAGTYYYYCVVSAPNAAPVHSDVAMVTLEDSITKTEVNSFAQLQNAIDNAPLSTAQTEIIVTSNIDFTRAVSVPSNKNIKISSLKDCYFTITATENNRHFVVNEGARLTLENITLDGGYTGAGTTTRGGIENYGSLTLDFGAIIQKCYADFGGGIVNIGIGFDFIGGVVYINGGEIIGNTARNNGGGIYNEGTVIINGGVIVGNTALENGGGIYNNGLVGAINSEFIDNTANNGGFRRNATIGNRA